MSYPGKKERIIATVEARMTSSRLPGKVMLPLAGMPALELLVRRLQKSKYLDGICIATTVNAADDEIDALAKRLGVAVFRGSETDVLGRVLAAAKAERAGIIVEITGDCPFVDPGLVDRGIEEFFSRDVDYVSNMQKQTFADGFDVQVFRTQTLADVDRATNDKIDRAHVSYYIYTHPERFRLYNIEASPELQAPGVRLMVDEENDYRALSSLAEVFGPRIVEASAAEITACLRLHPEVVAMNSQVRQKEAYEL